MLSPMMTVFVLAVLWLIVVVPMIVRRNDERKRDRSVAGFGRAMRALGRRAQASRADVFVAGRSTGRSNAATSAPPTVSSRRPVPAAQEALMYPVDHAELSAARAHMMARRRRSLGILGVGTVVLAPTAVLTGGIMWLVALPFLLGLTGYLWFLRNQAQRDRERRLNRQQRALERRTRSVDLTADVPETVEPAADARVRIDDDDIELHDMDTIDLTGVYEAELASAAAQRRAS